MIARDRIVLRFKNTAGDPVEEIVRGVIVTDDVDATLGPIGPPFTGTVPIRRYRVILPRTLDLSDAREVTLSYRDRRAVRPEVAVAPIYDARGRVHHYEAIVR